MPTKTWMETQRIDGFVPFLRPPLVLSKNYFVKDLTLFKENFRMGRSTSVNAEALVTWIKKQKSRAKYEFVIYKRTKNMRKKIQVLQHFSHKTVKVGCVGTQYKPLQVLVDGHQLEFLKSSQKCKIINSVLNNSTWTLIPFLTFSVKVENRTLKLIEENVGRNNRNSLCLPKYF